MKQKIKEKHKCEICGKKSYNWYKCHNKYFCCLNHLEKYEMEDKKDGD
jgi:hypothetical protein